MQFYPLRLISDNTKIDFMYLSKYIYIFSILLTTLSIIFLFTLKLNFGIDFAGGITIEARISEIPDLGKMREVLTNLNIGEISIQNFGSDKDIAIRVGTADANEEQIMVYVEKIKSALQSEFKYEIEYRKVDFVGPQVGDQLIIAGVQAIMLSFLGILIYVWFRFEWQFGVGILTALVHDTIIALGFMSVTDLDFNLASIAALLTIIGYSVNDSVVIYDRIRENLRKYRSKSIDYIVNLSVNETLSRTTLTVLTTLLTNLALIIWGGEAIRSFSILMFFGIIVGTYSSIYISAPLLKILRIEEFSGAKEKK
jgi:preprotein translocase subunit SecF